MSDNNAVVRTSRLTKVYGEGDSRVTVLDNVDVAFHRGEFTAVMGPVVFFERGRVATELRAPTEALVNERMAAVRQRRRCHV